VSDFDHETPHIYTNKFTYQ
jgi:hypothetical protein